jgi:cyclopropane-fatty-acyl-phospholipid synthase
MGNYLMSSVTERAIGWTESGLVPDSVIRSGIRRLLERKLVEIKAGNVEFASETVNAFVEMMNNSPIALVPDLANEQHYEVPASFFEQVLGKFGKYSCGHWPEGVNTLDDAEAAALRTTAERAQIEDGMDVLDLGCGWGSLSLWIAQHFPNCNVHSVSNSKSQGAFIRQRARERGLENLTVYSQDMNDFEIEHQFDRVVSVEMFEHMRNYGELFKRIDAWLKPNGKFFMHIFTHRTTPYEYIDKGPSDWMTRHFFSGGIMPCAELPMRFPQHLKIEQRWAWNGKHYARTCRAWLRLIDERKELVMPILKDTYGDADASRWFMRWRIFFMACEELFNFHNGDEWFVSHYRFAKAGS